MDIGVIQHTIDGFISSSMDFIPISGRTRDKTGKMHPRNRPLVHGWPWMINLHECVAKSASLHLQGQSGVAWCNPVAEASFWDLSPDFSRLSVKTHRSWSLRRNFQTEDSALLFQAGSQGPLRIPETWSQLANENWNGGDIYGLSVSTYSQWWAIKLHQMTDYSDSVPLPWSLGCNQIVLSHLRRRARCQGWRNVMSVRGISEFCCRGRLVW